VMRSFAMFTTTPNEARLRADVVLLVGRGLSRQSPVLFERLALEKGVHFQNGAARKTFWLGPKAGEDKIEGADIEALSVSPEALPLILAALRARVAGRPVAVSEAVAKKLDATAEALKAARFGVAIWSGSTVDTLVVEALQGLLSDLNATTRFTGIPIGARSGAAGVTQVSGWMTGFPPRTGFGRGFPEHDAWRFEAKRLVESGETDTVLWISAYDGEPPPWKTSPAKLVTLAPKDAKPGRGLHISIGRPGEDHDSLEFSQAIASFALTKATAPSGAPSVATAIAAIDARISEDASC